MKRTVFAFTASVMLAGTFALAQDSQTPSPQAPRPAAPAVTQPAPSASQDKSVPEVRLTGCLIQGSSPTIFVLDNARQSTDAKTAEGKKFVVVMADAAGLRNQLNRQVTIVGTADGKSAPQAAAPDAAQAKADERDLPRLSAKTIVRVADVCTTT